MTAEEVNKEIVKLVHEKAMKVGSITQLCKDNGFEPYYFLLRYKRACNQSRMKEYLSVLGIHIEKVMSNVYKIHQDK